MTELIRDLVRAMKGTLSPQAEVNAPLAAARTLPVELRVPKTPNSWDSVVSQLKELLSRQAIALHLDRDVDVRVRFVSADRLAVAIEGRPVAVGIDPGLQDHPDKLLATIDDRLRRRLSLLLADSADPVSAYLADHGFARQDDASPAAGLAPRTPGEAGQPELSAEELGEVELAVRQPSLRVEVAERTLRQADPKPAALLSLRRALFARKGIQFPDLQLVPTPDPAGTVRLTANDVHVGPFVLGKEAGWTTVVDRVLDPFLRHHASWFVCNLDIERAFDELDLTLPDMGATFLECYPRQYMLTACVRNFVREGRSVRNLPRILWLLMEIGPGGVGSDKLSFSENPLLCDPVTPPNARRDPAMVAARIRKCLAEESWRVGVPIMPNAVQLPASVESALLDASDPAALAQAEWMAVEAAAGYPGNATVVTSSVHAVAPVHKALRALPDRLRVVAAQELPPGQSLRR